MDRDRGGDVMYELDSLLEDLEFAPYDSLDEMMGDIVEVGNAFKTPNIFKITGEDIGEWSCIRNDIFYKLCRLQINMLENYASIKSEFKKMADLYLGMSALFDVKEESLRRRLDDVKNREENLEEEL